MEGIRRTIREEEFRAAWSGSGHWALLVLPPQQIGELEAPAVAATDASSPIASDDCSAMVEAGILLARQGDSAEAELKRFFLPGELFNY